MQYQYLFKWDMRTLYKKRTVNYLTKWVETIEAIQAYTNREMEAIGGVQNCTEDNQSEATYSTRDLDEYLVDVNDGMEIEDDMANNGADNEGQEGEAECEVVMGCSQDMLVEVSGQERLQRQHNMRLE